MSCQNCYLQRTFLVANDIMKIAQVVTNLLCRNLVPNKKKFVGDISNDENLSPYKHFTIYKLCTEAPFHSRLECAHQNNVQGYIYE